MFVQRGPIQGRRVPYSFAASSSALSRGSSGPTAQAISTVAIEFLTIFMVAFSTSTLYCWIVLEARIPIEFYASTAFLLAGATIVIALACRQYAFQERGRAIFLLDGMFALIFAFSVLLSVLFLSKASQEYSRAIFLAQFVTASLATLSMRAVVFSFFRSDRGRAFAKFSRTILVGEEADRLAYAANLEAAGRQIVASYPFPDATFRSATQWAATDAIETRSVLEAARSLRADEVIIVAKSSKLKETVELARVLSNVPLTVQVIPLDMIDVIPAARIVEVGGAVTIQVSHPPLSAFDQLLKRVADVCIAVVALVILSPVLLLAAAAIKLESRGPVIFRQLRHGYNYRPIVVYKFRSMRAECCNERFVQASVNDHRVTRVGRFLRRFNIDELPQFINVLHGNMSIVGPRPHATEHNREFEHIIPPFARRHNVKPGITGWAQVNGYRGPTDSIDKMQRRVEHDLYYIDNWSFLFDLQIILLTLFSKKSYSNSF